MFVNFLKESSIDMFEAKLMVYANPNPFVGITFFFLTLIRTLDSKMWWFPTLPLSKCMLFCYVVSSLEAINYFKRTTQY